MAVNVDDDAIPTNWTLRLALTSLLLVVLLALFLLFCIQAGRDGVPSTLRAWKIALIGSPYRDYVPAKPATATPTDRARVSVHPPVAQATRPPAPAPTAAATTQGSEPGKVAAALRASLAQYRAEPGRTSTVTLTTAGAVKTQGATTATALDGIPTEPASGGSVR